MAVAPPRPPLEPLSRIDAHRAPSSAGPGSKPHRLLPPALAKLWAAEIEDLEKELHLPRGDRAALGGGLHHHSRKHALPPLGSAPAEVRVAESAFVKRKVPPAGVAESGSHWPGGAPLPWSEDYRNPAAWMGMGHLESHWLPSVAAVVGDKSHSSAASPHPPKPFPQPTAPAQPSQAPVAHFHAARGASPFSPQVRHADHPKFTSAKKASGVYLAPVVPGLLPQKKHRRKRRRAVASDAGEVPQHEEGMCNPRRSPSPHERGLCLQPPSPAVSASSPSQPPEEPLHGGRGGGGRAVGKPQKSRLGNGVLHGDENGRHAASSSRCQPSEAPPIKTPARKEAMMPVMAQPPPKQRRRRRHEEHIEAAKIITEELQQGARRLSASSMRSPTSPVSVIEEQSWQELQTSALEDLSVSVVGICFEEALGACLEGEVATPMQDIMPTAVAASSDPNEMDATDSVISLCLEDMFEEKDEMAAAAAEEEEEEELEMFADHWTLALSQEAIKVTCSDDEEL